MSDQSGYAVTFCLLGRFEVETARGCVASPNGKRSRAILARLVLAIGGVVNRSQLAAEVWPDCDVSLARRNLRQALFGVRQWADEIAPGLVRVNEESAWIDSDTATSDIKFLEAAAGSLDSEVWQRAVQNYRGSFMAECSDSWCVYERQRIDELVVDVLFKLINFHFKLGDIDSALRLARQTVKVDPFGERSNSTLIRILASSGQMTAAKSHYTAFEQRLKEGLDSRPFQSFQSLIAKDLGKQARNTRSSAESQLAPIDWSRITSQGGRKGVTLAIVLPLVLLALVFTLGYANRSGATNSDILREFRVLSGLPKKDDAVRSRQAELLNQLSTIAVSTVYGSDEDLWLNRLSPYLDEASDVLVWAADRKPQTALKFGGNLARFAVLTGKHQKWCDALCVALQKTSKQRTTNWALAACSQVNAVRIEDLDSALDRLKTARKIYEDQADYRGVAHVARMQGFALSSCDHWKESEPYFEEALRINKMIRNDSGVALTLLCLGYLPPDEKQGTTSTERIIQLGGSVDCFLAVGNKWGIVFAGDKLREMVLRCLHSPNHVPLMRGCRDRLRSIRQWCASHGDMVQAAAFEDADLRLSIRLDDRVSMAYGLARGAYQGVGQPYPLRTRYLMAVAAERLDRKLYGPSMDEYRSKLVQLVEQSNGTTQANSLKIEAENMSTKDLLASFDP